MEVHDAPDIAGAIDAWSRVVGPENVKSDADTIERYARTTQRQAPKPSCVLYPRSREDVQAIVRVANEHRVVVYPISCGKNWGYGDACPTSEGAAIVDLGRMNKILEVNTQLAYCVIEPGVTQQQLYDYLQDNKTGLWMDASAAGPDSSLVGNTVDRGFGHTRYGDHFLTCCGMEIVLPDGRVLDTGFGQYANAKAARVYRYGVGPFLDGIFCQSNLGIVTKIGLWLMPEPEAFNFFYLRIDKFEDFETVVDRLRPLRMGGILQTAIHVGNEFRVMAGSGKFPWQETGGKAPIPDELLDEIRRRRGARAWHGSGSITGTAAHVRASRRALIGAMKGLGDVRFLTDRSLRRRELIATVLNAFGLAKGYGHWWKRIVRPNYELLKGVPHPEPLLGAQWRLRHASGAPQDPLDLGCGLYWISPVMPMIGGEAMNLLRIAKPIFNDHGFDMIVSFILLTERCLVAIFNIAFDKSIPEECDQASACYEALVDAMQVAGYPLYRAGIQGMPKIRNDSVFWQVARDIKEKLDPNDIIARGRYIAPLDSQ